MCPPIIYVGLKSQNAVIELFTMQSSEEHYDKKGMGREREREREINT
jgi:hypothetical protein